MNHENLNKACGTYFQLASHLFEAVLNEDMRKVRSLLSVGVDADQEVEWAVRGPLACELQVTTARHLACSLSHESILRALDTEVSGDTLLTSDLRNNTSNSSYIAEFLNQVSLPKNILS